MASTEGASGAWRAALGADPKAALQGISGDFAVGMRLPGDRVFLAVDRFAIRSLCYRVDNGQIR
ncbi:MAG: asparagine synthase, partial [Rhodoferax sp.]|nr:asparagine synthase [Rhodoferax sp.]